MESDPDGKKTTQFNLNVLTSTFKQTFWEEYMDEDPYYYDLVDLVNAELTFSGHDSVANRDVKAVGRLQIQVGNLYDDVSRFGQ